jgi:hypothetical protein
VGLLSRQFDVVLLVFGKGEYLPEMEALARKLGVADRVLIHGFVPQEELLDGIANAHVGVIAARRDSFRDLTHTQKMYEYVAMRKPVVIAETSAVRTHFDDSCFQFFASDDPADLARALLELYHDPQRALEMIESADCRYRVYSWETQRHVYAAALLDGVPQHAPARVPEHEPAVPVVPTVPTVPAVPARITSQQRTANVTSVVAPGLALSSMELSGMVAPTEELDI